MAGASATARALRRAVGATRRRRDGLAALALALLAAGVVLLVSVRLFPYHSANHDEAVYLQQAGLLLAGRLGLSPPVPEAMVPWFFLAEGGTLYPKYAPVPAAVFALGKAVAGSYRAALAAVAAANVLLAWAVVAEAFDRRTGLLAAGLLLSSPLFVLQSATFLPYAPTTALNLAFALGYLRARRAAGRRRLGYAALAGTAVGLAFFARPYTAVLFAAPFVLHACWELGAARPVRPVLARQAVVAGLGLAGVAVALGYNAAVTGSPWLFPYEAFAPLDGPGFGHRALLGPGLDYTPLLALRANAEVLARLFGRWAVAGPAGTALAAVGLGALLRDAWRAGSAGRAVRALRAGDRPTPADRQARALLAGLFVSVPAGNLLFWGNYNVLGALAVRDDGFVALLGPYYHFDLLVPTAAFAAAGAVLVAERARAALDRRRAAGRLTGRQARALALAGLAVGAAVLAGTTALAAAGPVRANAEVAADYERAYAPFESRDLDDAVVFLPSPYDDAWLNHPFQALRNDPGFGGPVVYALDRGGRRFRVVDAYPDRARYRYSYRGRWAPVRAGPVTPRLRRVRVVGGDRVVLSATVGVPDGADRVSVRVGSGAGQAYYAGNATGGELSLRLVVGPGRARLDGEVRPVGDGTLPVAGTDEVTVTVFVDGGAGSGFSYRLALPVDREGGGVRAMSPSVEVCRSPARCGGEAAYVPGATRPGVYVNATVEGV